MLANGANGITSDYKNCHTKGIPYNTNPFYQSLAVAPPILTLSIPVTSYVYFVNYMRHSFTAKNFCPTDLPQIKPAGN